MRAPRREIAVVFQDYGKALLPWRTATGNVSLALETIGMPVAVRYTEFDGFLHDFIHLGRFRQGLGQCYRIG